MWELEMGGKAIAKILGILFHPRAEWERIKKAPSFSSGRFLKGVLCFSAVSPILKFIFDFLYGNIRRPFYGLSWNVLWDYVLRSFVSYLLSVLSAFLALATISMAAKLFFSKKEVPSSRVLVYYSFIPFWLSGICYAIPKIGGMLKVALSLYMFYVLFLGMNSNLLNIPREKIKPYFLSCSSVIIVLFAILELTKLVFLFL